MRIVLNLSDSADSQVLFEFLKAVPIEDRRTLSNHQWAVPKGLEHPARQAAVKALNKCHKYNSFRLELSGKYYLQLLVWNTVGIEVDNIELADIHRGQKLQIVTTQVNALKFLQVHPEHVYSSLGSLFYLSPY